MPFGHDFMKELKAISEKASGDLSSRAYYQSIPELVVTEIPSHRCTTCSHITFSSFRTTRAADELFNPQILILGNFLTVVRSAFNGCHVCRLLAREIGLRATNLRELILLYKIGTVGLQLSLDDELSLHCWDDDGSKWRLSDVVIEDIQLVDAAWQGTSDLKPGKKSQLKFHMLEEGGHSILTKEGSNLLVLNPRSEDQQRLLPHWLLNCQAMHSQCSSRFDQDEPSPDPLLPTRVLDLYDPKNPEVIHLLITNGQSGNYVTMSHCWDQSSHGMTLNRGSMQSLVDGLSWEELPPSFRDAVMMTRALGFRYIWIDSICIVQPTVGDYADWEIEGAKMGDYYANSSLTIAATAATDNTEGCLMGRPFSQYDITPVPLFQEPVDRKWHEFDQEMGRSSKWVPMMQPKPASFLHHVHQSPLNSRAWVLQERILSPRILHCTLQGLMWECAELRATEFEPFGCLNDYHVRDQGLENLNQLTDADHAYMTGPYWRHVVERFCKLNITVQTDRLPALSGIAEKIGTQTGDVYVAGHWRNTLLVSLLWFRIGKAAQVSPTPLPNAPSWSWASSTGAVKFTPLDAEDYPTREPGDYTTVVEVLSLEAMPTDRNKFSWLTSSKLVLHAPLLKRNSGQGFPELEIKSLSEEEVWEGHVPMPRYQTEKKTIRQMKAIKISRADEKETTVPEGNSYHSKLDPGDPGNDASSVRNLSSKGGGDEGEANPSKSCNKEPSNSEWASIATSHPAIQAEIMAQVEEAAATESWKQIAQEQSAVEEAKTSAPQKVKAILDFPNEAIDERKIALLQLLYATPANSYGWDEGLLLIRDARQGTYKRVGFFSTDGQPGSRQDVFRDIDKTQVELV